MLYSVSNLTEICSQGLDGQFSSIDSYNGVVPPERRILGEIEFHNSPKVINTKHCIIL